MFLTKLKVGTAVLFGIVLFAAGGTLTHQALSARQTETIARAPTKKAPQVPKNRPEPEKPKDTQETVVYSGRVLGPERASVPAQNFYMTLALGISAPAVSFARICHHRGRWPIHLPSFEIGIWRREHRGCGCRSTLRHRMGECWAHEKTKEHTIRLMKNDVPITGANLDLEGKPVVGRHTSPPPGSDGSRG